MYTYLQPHLSEPLTNSINPQKNPLHISIFPSQPSNAPLRTPLQFSLILSSTLDIFEARAKVNASAAGGLSGDFGLLHAIDERLAAYGFETNTGVRFVAIVDMRGRIVGDDAARGHVTGLREGEMKLVSATLGGLMRGADGIQVFRAMQTAYVGLLQNPFYDPDEHSPPTGRGGKKITSRKFMEEIRRTGESWVPGQGAL